MIAARLAHRGIPFRALVRPSSDGSALEALGADVVPGDLTDRASLDRALTGAAGVERLVFCRWPDCHRR